MENVVDISKFYSKDNEENGMWMEPKVQGVGVGFEVKVYGPNSTAAAVAQDNYQKAKDEVLRIEDIKTRSEKMDKILSEYAASLICDIRGKDGATLVNNGEKVTVQDMKKILYNAPVIASDIARFETNQNNFLSK